MIIEASKVRTWYVDTEKTFQERFDRMDESYRLWDLTQVLYDEHENSINITSNDPRKLADWLHSLLTSAKRQIIIRLAEVEGEDKRDDIAKLERLHAFAFDMADRRLIRMLMPTLREYFAWSSPVRGWIAGRVLVEKSKTKGGNVIFNITPFDPRWLVYEEGEAGLFRVGYKTFRSHAELKAQYDYEPSTAWYNPMGLGAGKAKPLEVIEFWENLGGGKFAYSLVCGDKYLIGEGTQIFKLKSMPIIIKPVTLRPPIVGNIGNEFLRYGDDVFAPNRKMYDVKNKLLSLWATHANKMARSPLINYFGMQGNKDITDAFNTAGGVINLPQGENEIREVPMKEISATLVSMVQWADDEIQQASVPDVVYGQMESGPWSGTSLGVLREAANKVLGPQIRTLEAFYSSMCELIEEQLIDSRQNVTIKSELDKKYYEVKVTPIDLGKSHITRVEFSATTPWEQLDSLQQADMAQALDLPLEFIWEHMLKLQDPKGLSELKAMEVTEHMPEFMMLKAIKGFVKLGRLDEARRLMEKMAQMAMAEEQQAGQVPSEGVPEELPIEPRGGI